MGDESSEVPPRGAQHTSCVCEHRRGRDRSTNRRPDRAEKAKEWGTLVVRAPNEDRKPAQCRCGPQEGGSIAPAFSRPSLDVDGPAFNPSGGFHNTLAQGGMGVNHGRDILGKEFGFFCQEQLVNQFCCLGTHGMTS